MAEECGDVTGWRAFEGVFQVPPSDQWIATLEGQLRCPNLHLDVTVGLPVRLAMCLETLRRYSGGLDRIAVIAASNRLTRSLALFVEPRGSASNKHGSFRKTAGSQKPRATRRGVSLQII